MIQYTHDYFRQVLFAQVPHKDANSQITVPGGVRAPHLVIALKALDKGAGQWGP